MQPHAAPITDIWFRSPLSLDALAAALGLSDVAFDAEDYWEWAVGTLDDIRLDITRTHTQPSWRVDTRLFRLDNLPFAPRDQRVIVERLLQAVAGPVSCGCWVYQSGNNFDLQLAERFERSI